MLAWPQQGSVECEGEEGEQKQDGEDDLAGLEGTAPTQTGLSHRRVRPAGRSDLVGGRWWSHLRVPGDIGAVAQDWSATIVVGEGKLKKSRDPR